MCVSYTQSFPFLIKCRNGFLAWFQSSFSGTRGLHFIFVFNVEKLPAHHSVIESYVI